MQVTLVIRSTKLLLEVDNLLLELLTPTAEMFEVVESEIQLHRDALLDFLGCFSDHVRREEVECYSTRSVSRQ